MLPSVAFAANCSSLTSNIISWYELDSNGNDSLSTNNLTGVNSPTFTSSGGKPLGYVTLNGSNQYLDNTTPSGIPTSGDFSMGGWFYVTSSAFGADEILMGQDDTNRSWFFTFSPSTPLTASKLLFYTGNGGVPNSNSLGTAVDTWYHWIAVYHASSGNVDFYQNGALLNTGTGAGTLQNTTQTFRIGNDGTFGQFFPGRVDSVGMWSCALTASQVSTLYNSGSGIDYPFTPAAPAFQLWPFSVF